MGVEVAGTRGVEDEVMDERMEAANEAERSHIRCIRTVTIKPRVAAEIVRRQNHNTTAHQEA